MERLYIDVFISSRDISFLYDVPGDQGKSEKPNLGDNSELRHDEAGESKHVSNNPHRPSQNVVKTFVIKIIC